MGQTPPQWSPDGKWWWDGQHWVAASQTPAQFPPMPGPNAVAAFGAPPRQSHTARNLAIGCAGVIGLIVILAIIGSISSSPSSSRDQLRTAAAARFERLDSTYFKDSQAALAKGHTIAPDAYQQAMLSLADANHAFAQGLQQIPFPDSAKNDATALLNATVQDETDATLEAARFGTVGADKISADFDVRNAADRQLRKDLGLNVSEVPAG